MTLPLKHPEYENLRFCSILLSLQARANSSTNLLLDYRRSFSRIFQDSGRIYFPEYSSWIHEPIVLTATWRNHRCSGPSLLFF